MAAIEGRNAVFEALRAGMPVRRIMIAEGTQPDRTLDEIARLAAEVGVEVARVPKRELDRQSERGSHQGVIADAAPYKYASLDAVLARAEGKERSLIIALDHITDPGNLGAIVRTAEVVGADGVLVANRRAAARVEKNWAKADAVRDGLTRLGFTIEDTQQGARVIYKP